MIRLAISYVASLLAASLFCAVATEVIQIVRIWPFATPYVLGTHLFMMPTIWLAGFAFSVPMGIIPGTIFLLISRRFNLNGKTYWAAIGGFSAVLTVAVAAYLISVIGDGATGDGEDVSYNLLWLQWSLVALPSGVLAGLLFRQINISKAAGLFVPID